ncbi:hypothetical protein M2165_000411 [Variovorax sp. TBS-050B]|uniref:hypothetical protein n=1 Tax=Variovorax sp. TBS-050B TaxID=2940551 RepID=UPI0024758A64|nr:hypothetical protein [Variovorax sp. TBS-050B]MDH6590522.1 hypothetical protein [Variovorax sp. TBS-050B]
MQKQADLYICEPVRSERLKFIALFDGSFSYDAEKCYSGYLGLNAGRVKLISIVSDLRAHNVDCFGVPIEYRDLENIPMSQALEFAKEHAAGVGASVFEISKFQSRDPPVYWKFGLNQINGFEEKAGGIVMIDRLDGHVWTNDENEEYMYDYNNIF